MDFALSVIYGITIKVYDDITDTGIPVTPLILELLKTLQTIILSIISYSDFNYSAVFYGINIVAMIADDTAYLGDDYYNSIFYLYPIFLVLSFGTRRWITGIEIFCLFLGGLFFALEPIVIKENVSYRKFILRSLGIIATICVIIIGFYIGLSPSLLKLLFSWLGYVTTSSIFQGYMLIKNNDISTSRILHG